MVVDSSAIASLLLDEADAEFYQAAIESGRNLKMSSISALELTIVIGRRKGQAALARLDHFLAQSGIEIVPFDSDQLQIAKAAWLRFGKGRHAARLNLGDCCSYALAKQTGESLLCKGGDFIQTDLACIASPE